MSKKVTEEGIWEIQDKKDFGKYTVRRTSMEEWEVLEGRLIVLPSTTERKVAGFLNSRKW